MYAKIAITASECEAFSKEEIIELYCEARRSAAEYDDFEPMKAFKSLFPAEYKYFSAVARKRCEIRKSVDAMGVIGPIYFGTLTYNNDKDSNSEEYKRKEAFEALNSVFEYVLLVEEYGGDNGRYHIHFLGVFRSDHDFDSFKASWSHSRQNLRLLGDNDKIDKYLVKYLTKDLPRLRRNKNLCSLVKHYKECSRVQSKSWILPEKREKAWADFSDFLSHHE